MKIAIDVHSLGTQASGNESYFRQLLWGLKSDKSDNQYTLLYAHPAALEEAGGDSRFIFVSIPSSPVPRLCFSCPRLLAKLRPDVFHCQYVLPPFVKTKTVLSIHDLAYEHFPEFF